MHYFVPVGTSALVICDGADWIEKNIRQYVTEHESAFTEAELIVDPTAAGCGCLTIGDVYAQMNYFGFRRNGWVLLVPAEEVEKF